MKPEPLSRRPEPTYPRSIDEVETSAPAQVEIASADGDLDQLTPEAAPNVFLDALSVLQEAEDYEASARPSCMGQNDPHLGRVRYAPREAAERSAAAAIASADSPAELRGMIDGLGPRAGELVEALRLDHPQASRDRGPAIEALLWAAAEGPPSEASQAVLLLAFDRLTPRMVDGSAKLRAGLADALVAHWPSDPPVAGERMEALFGSTNVSAALFDRTQPLESKAELLQLLRDHPERDAAIRGSSESPWLDEALLRAHADGAVARQGPPGARPTVDLPDDLRAPIERAIREAGGASGRVERLSITFASATTGPVDLPLYRVTDPQTGEPRYVDNLARTYSSFEDWRADNALPPGKVVYPAGGAAGAPWIVEDTETRAERALQFVDTAALVGGTIAAGAMIIGTGGVATPIVFGLSAGATLWGTGRAVAGLGDRWQHGQSIDPVHDRQARSQWLTVGANAFGLAGLGATALQTSRTLANGLNGAATAADGIATYDAFDTLRSEEGLDDRTRFGLAMQVLFFGAGAGASLRRIEAPELGATPRRGPRLGETKQITEAPLDPTRTELLRRGATKAQLDAVQDGAEALVPGTGSAALDSFLQAPQLLDGAAEALRLERRRLDAAPAGTKSLLEDISAKNLERVYRQLGTTTVARLAEELGGDQIVELMSLGRVEAIQVLAPGLGGTKLYALARLDFFPLQAARQRVAQGPVAAQRLPPLEGMRINEIENILKRDGFKAVSYSSRKRMGSFTHPDGSLVRIKDFHPDRYMQPGRKVTKELAADPTKIDKEDNILCKFTDDNRLVPVGPPGRSLEQWFRANLHREAEDVELEAAKHLWGDQAHIPISN
jgi:hypothetical protein